MTKVKSTNTQVNGLQQSVVKANGNIDNVESTEFLETDDAVETNELDAVDGDRADDEEGGGELSPELLGSNSTTGSQKATSAFCIEDSNATTGSQKATSAFCIEDSNDGSDLEEGIESNQSIESIELTEDDGIDEIEFPPLTDKPVQVPEAAARYGISRQAFYKRLNYLNFKAESIDGKSYLSREQMETLDKLAKWIRKKGSMNGFLGEGALVVSQGNSIQKKSNAIKTSTVPRTGKASRDRQLSDAAIVAKRAELRAAQMLIGEDVAVNYLLENPDKISDEVMDEVLSFREGMQGSMVDSAVGKPFDPDTFANDILNCFAQAG